MIFFIQFYDYLRVTEVKFWGVKFQVHSKRKIWFLFMFNLWKVVWVEFETERRAQHSKADQSVHTEGADQLAVEIEGDREGEAGVGESVQAWGRGLSKSEFNSYCETRFCKEIFCFYKENFWQKFFSFFKERINMTEKEKGEQQSIENCQVDFYNYYYYYYY